MVARPGLWERLSGPARVTVVSAPTGSGKTVLLRSWISHAGLAERVAWVPADRDERDPQRFWLPAVAALRRTTPGSALVQALTAAPELDGWAITERLLADLAPLEDRIWLLVDDVHELGEGVLRQLELLVLRAPRGLRFVLAARLLAGHWPALHLDGQGSAVHELLAGFPRRDPLGRCTAGDAGRSGRAGPGICGGGGAVPGPGRARIGQRARGLARAVSDAARRRPAAARAGSDQPWQRRGLDHPVRGGT